ncbi:hypothetical protein [Massilia rhizosphaerae]|uniref:hypothetical protein n=1 Tax=Massilia rhizosphaerae TaxID=2784389 RepID=UPI001E546CED|nr:hypothetical protein [Massilia rhizosphaerae]
MPDTMAATRASSAGSVAIALVTRGQSASWAVDESANAVLAEEEMSASIEARIECRIFMVNVNGFHAASSADGDQGGARNDGTTPRRLAKDRAAAAYAGTVK